MTNAPTTSGAISLDYLLQEAQLGLIEGLPWLDASFGRSQRIVRMQGGRRIVTPNVFCGGWKGHGENDYLEVSPDSKIGNFSFFEIEDPQTIETGATWARSIKVPISLIVWFDLRRVYETASYRNIEYLKEQVLHILNGGSGWHLSHGRITIAKTYERAENIYRGYTLSETDNQFLIHPFGGLRFEGWIDYTELCFNGPLPPELTWYLRTSEGIYYMTSELQKIIVKH